MKEWKKKPEWERRADWDHYDALCAEFVKGNEPRPKPPEHPRFECKDCKKAMTKADTDLSTCNACCDSYTQADFAFDAKRELILITGIDPDHPPEYPDDD